MRIEKISSLHEYEELIELSSAYMWRGVSDSAYELIPKIGRDWHLGPEALKIFEKHLLDQYKIRATPFLIERPINDWEWLAIAQHYGLPTRLLDWTRNPLIALYFACLPNERNDGAVYFSKCINEIDTKSNNPFDVVETEKWSAQYLNPRLSSQDGLFVVGPDPTVPQKEGIILRMDIANKAKVQLLKTLNRFGIHEASIFPGLDTAASYVENTFFAALKGFKDLEALKAALEKSLEE